ncbi:gamma-glutamylcyclotransferase family protein [Pseudalkalibacillus berkeleyi]|uniref:Gamma-glutamylcyclotransferase family protein n=1 Tax=Pseudalkalibacillus berkeleyi TaxID=1069813 RepID=A0ABS9GX90_9BACL|nr:gamma-glutamylcyclotransferase family protein [Pseudalkalibacillus berkeleyi]MCF6136346.1 gamma-glutamylcyclotransferase [Pseudalkalibacillus berkeleyi]
MSSKSQIQDKNMKSSLVFVYGTLRKGESNHHLLAGTNCVNERAWINGTLYDTGQGYPALSLTPFGSVYGEVYEVDDKLISKLDQLEGYQFGRERNLYEREMKKIMTNDGLVETYIYTVDHNPSLCIKRIECGDWVNRS